jgi:hypothetical protein
MVTNKADGFADSVCASLFERFISSFSFKNLKNRIDGLKGDAHLVVTKCDPHELDSKPLFEISIVLIDQSFFRCISFVS